MIKDYFYLIVILKMTIKCYVSTCIHEYETLQEIYDHLITNEECNKFNDLEQEQKNFIIYFLNYALGL